jgi:hypothetical protein
MGPSRLRRFKKLACAGFTAVKRLGEGRSEILRSFDTTAEETLFIPGSKADDLGGGGQSRIGVVMMAISAGVTIVLGGYL